MPELPTNPGNGPDRINGGVDGDGGPDGSTSTPSPGPGDPVQPPDDNPIKVGTYPIPEPPGTEGQIKNWTVYYKSVSIAGELKRCSDDELINSNDLEYGEEKILTGQGTLLSIEIDKVTTTITCENIPNEDYLKPVLTLTTTQLDGSQKNGIIRFRQITTANAGIYQDPPRDTSVVITRITADGVDQPVPI